MALMAALFIMTSCGGGNSPKSVTEKAMKALLDKDYDKFVEYVYLTPKEGEDIEGSKKMLSGMLQGKAEQMYAKKEDSNRMRLWENRLTRAATSQLLK